MSKSLQPPPGTAAIPSDDAYLVAALRSGDELAFANLVQRLHHSLVRLARLYVADNAAEDVAQETWLARPKCRCNALEQILELSPLAWFGL